MARDGAVETLVKARAVLDVLAESGPCSVKTVSERVGEATSSTYRMIANLQALGWVEPAVRRGEYRLGLACMRIGGQVASSIDVQDVARQVFHRHRSQFGTWGLFVRRQLRCVCIQVQVREAVSSYSQMLGTALPLLVGAAPGVLGAYMPADRFEQLLEHYSYDNTLGGRISAVRQQAVRDAAKVRAAGFAFDVSETMPGVITLAMPVFNHGGEVEAAVTFSGVARTQEKALRRMLGQGAVDAGVVPELGTVGEVACEISAGLGSEACDERA